ncbi:hypothetical protein BATDEDRAFT_90992 [Batrachochytrium dendrobatidis JAM81]|uniref:VWFA domain-containing protein n=2 Tax=Batrachochytrium dendrobatidis TaxID=109871 RepID=F4P901_BATDJ|nr:uncharacterized protein BATDEDRAFT_90992 [Batrachochytrium dendrobatidis JAM81]EGF78091.1 hypothetical protein BATDEDRAFT_90992 [Batrachochytrium dendrobatidis JAM81]OAJ44286.1 hypothetical protein BDEG_27536 [Batrachochytrium dendrobatidis JEL423]|eukprot:XP_006681194.1 hypothetical protein BATDEDRAFT_90992 [Batrachochytrium dendrobatidis JAM81]
MGLLSKVKQQQALATAQGTSTDPASTGPLSHQIQESVNITYIREKLYSIVTDNKLQAWYNPDRLTTLIDHLTTLNYAYLRQEWKVYGDLVYDLVSLALYDIVFFIDDSGSMAFEEDGERIQDLKLILAKIANVAGLLDTDGIQVRFMNNSTEIHGVTTQSQVEDLIGKIRFSGMTPLGSQFKAKVVDPIVLGPAVNGTLTKPILAIIVTDGEPTREPIDTLQDVILDATQILAGTGCGVGALAIQVGQVGTDLKAQQFLARLDNDPAVGKMIDCTSNYEMESEEMMKKGGELSPEMWLLKLCVGAIDSTYDGMD